MSAGKTTLAIQTAYNLRESGENLLVITMSDRTENSISSRVGASFPAQEVYPSTDLAVLGRDATSIVCDEAQFLTAEQVEQLAWLSDEFMADVYAYGLRTSFQNVMFEGTKRLFELADEIHLLQVEVRCWCRARATCTARVVKGKMVTSGDSIVIDDGSGDTEYVILCRKHYNQQNLGE